MLTEKKMLTCLVLLLQLLLSGPGGADVNIIDNYGHTPLKIANLSKRTEIAAMLSEPR